MQVLVIGGTNFIGPHVVRYLLAMGHEVTVFHRGNSKADLPPEVHHILGDRHNLVEMKSAFERLLPQVVLDMILYTEHDALTTMSTFKGLTQRIVVISSIDVYHAYGVLRCTESGPVDPVPLTEDSPLRQQLYPFQHLPERPLNRPADYEKILVERVVMSDPDLPGTILRLPMVYGPGDDRHRLLPYLQRMNDNRRVIVLAENVAQWRSSYGYVENVAAAIALAATHERAKTRIYNIADLKVFAEAEWISKIGEIIGWQGKVVTVPKHYLPSEWKLDVNVHQHWFVDTTRIRQELGYSDVVHLDAALKRTIDWEKSHTSKDISPQAIPWLFSYATEDAILAAM